MLVFEKINSKFKDYMSKTFMHHTPSADGMEKIKVLRKAYADLNKVIDELVPNSRQKSVAITELETSAMWAIKGVIFTDENSEVELI